jgi:glycyl-tRNA synthetase beta chain
MSQYGDKVDDIESSLAAAMAFIGERMTVMLRDEGYAYDHVDAVLAVHGDRPLRAVRCLDAMAKLDAEQVQNLAEQTKRMQRIVKEPAAEAEASLLDDNERAFHALCGAAADNVRKAVDAQAFDAALTENLRWLPVISAYFDSVLVNDPDERKRANRHALVRDVLAATTIAADFTRIEKRA